jgi:hypothetical protein
LTEIKRDEIKAQYVKRKVLLRKYNMEKTELGRSDRRDNVNSISNDAIA